MSSILHCSIWKYIFTESLCYWRFANTTISKQNNLGFYHFISIINCLNFISSKTFEVFNIKLRLLTYVRTFITSSTTTTTPLALRLHVNIIKIDLLIISYNSYSITSLKNIVCSLADLAMFWYGYLIAHLTMLWLGWSLKDLISYALYWIVSFMIRYLHCISLFSSQNIKPTIVFLIQVLTSYHCPHFSVIIKLLQSLTIFTVLIV